MVKRFIDAIKDVIYFVRCHTVNRYHVINIAGQGDYAWGWIDRDNAMLLACFKLLVEFVEQEDPEVGLRTIDDYCSHEGSSEDCDFQHAAVDDQLRRDAEVRALYAWWTAGRAEEHRAAELAGWSRPDPLELDERDDAQLLRLMAVRRCLWT